MSPYLRTVLYLVAVSAVAGSVLDSLTDLGFDDSADNSETGSEKSGGGSSEEEFARGSRLLGGISNLFGLLGSGSRNCGPPDACPPHACRYDPAVIHGYCCGCAHPFDRVPIVCPGNLQCPLVGEPLCSDYNYMMDCCC